MGCDCCFGDILEILRERRVVGEGIAREKGFWTKRLMGSRMQIFCKESRGGQASQEGHEAQTAHNLKDFVFLYIEGLLM